MKNPAPTDSLRGGGVVFSLAQASAWVRMRAISRA